MHSCQHVPYTEDDSDCIKLQVAGISHNPEICNKSVCCHFLVHIGTLQSSTDEITWLSPIHRTLFKWKDVCWGLSQIIPRIIHETHTNNPIRLYSVPNHFQYMDSQTGSFAVFKISICTNLELNNAAFLNIVHILQHPSSCPNTKSTQTTMLNHPKYTFSPLLANTCITQLRGPHIDIFMWIIGRAAWW